MVLYPDIDIDIDIYPSTDRNPIRFDEPPGVIGAFEIVRNFQEQGIKTRAYIALIHWTSKEGARFFPPVGSSCVYAGQGTVSAAHESKGNNGSGETLGEALNAIGYVGDGPNTFAESPISAHFEIHVEQQTALEKAGKPVGWVEGWQGIDVFEVTMRGEDGHANAAFVYGRRDSLVGSSRLITALDELAYDAGGLTTATNIQSGPVGCYNIQSWTKTVFCTMHATRSGLEGMGDAITKKTEAIAARYGLVLEFNRIMHLEPGNFWPEAVDCVKRACGERGVGADTLTAHDSTMTRLVCPTAMVFARAKDGISHSAKEWSSKEDCAESALVLGRAVLNFDDLLK